MNRIQRKREQLENRNEKINYISFITIVLTVLIKEKSLTKTGTNKIYDIYINIRFTHIS